MHMEKSGVWKPMGSEFRAAGAQNSNIALRCNMAAEVKLSLKRKALLA
jgi:hypothetical protein